jgi:hypothetical protein
MVHTQMTGNPSQAHPVYVHLQRFLAGLFIICPRFGFRRIFQLAVHAAIPLTTAAGLPGSVLSFCSVAFRTADHFPILAQFFATPIVSTILLSAGQDVIIIRLSQVKLDL